TDELAVMCDTFRPLLPTKAALDLDDEAYPASWLSSVPDARGTAGMHTTNGEPKKAAAPKTVGDTSG
ncbi:MAG: hypothetical protein GY715_02910, partial [Planctomycetes bacterium]|nr:hypothetical protein [Planctomycetota bacterium]